MNTRWWGACGLAAAALACCATPALAARGDLNAYRVEASAKNLRALAEAGFDVTEGRDRKARTVEVVGTQAQIDALKVDAEKVVDGEGRDSADRSREVNPRRSSRLAVDPTAGASDAPTASGASTTPSPRRRQASNTRSSTTACSPTIPSRRRARRRPDLRRARHHRPAGDQGPDRRRHPRQAGRALQLDAARARVAGRRDLQAHAQLLRRQLRQDARAPAWRSPRWSTATSCGSSASTTRTATSTPSRRQPPVAKEPGRQRQQQDDRHRRRRRPEPQLLVQLGP